MDEREFPAFSYKKFQESLAGKPSPQKDERAFGLFSYKNIRLFSPKSVPYITTQTNCYFTLLPAGSKVSTN
jgi:hypothetical protein